MSMRRLRLRRLSYASHHNHTFMARQMRETGLTYNRIAMLLRRHETTVTKWGTGDYSPQWAEEFLINLLADNPEFRKWFLAIWIDCQRGPRRLPPMELAIELWPVEEEAAEEAATA